MIYSMPILLPNCDSATAGFVSKKETLDLPLHISRWFAVDYALPVPKSVR
jgi:hypothetical protein